MAGLWTRMLTALRGTANRPVHAAVTRQALRILDQEILEGEHRLAVSRAAIANLMGKSAVATTNLARDAERLKALSAATEMALAAGHEELALDLAGKIGKLEPLMEQEARATQEFSLSVHKLRAALQSSEDGLKAIKSRVDVIRATAQTQQAQAQVMTANGSSEDLQAAADCLDHIRLHQLENAARFQAQEELIPGDADLECRLREAGITDRPSAHQVLERIKLPASVSV